MPQNLTWKWTLRSMTFGERKYKLHLAVQVLFDGFLFVRRKWEYLASVPRSVLWGDFLFFLLLHNELFRCVGCILVCTNISCKRDTKFNSYSEREIHTLHLAVLALLGCSTLPPSNVHYGTLGSRCLCHKIFVIYFQLFDFTLYIYVERERERDLIIWLNAMQLSQDDML